MTWPFLSTAGHQANIAFQHCPPLAGAVTQREDRRGLLPPLFESLSQRRGLRSDCGDECHQDRATLGETEPFTAKALDEFQASLVAVLRSPVHLDAHVHGPPCHIGGTLALRAQPSLAFVLGDDRGGIRRGIEGNPTVPEDPPTSTALGPVAASWSVLSPSARGDASFNSHWLGGGRRVSGKGVNRNANGRRDPAPCEALLKSGEQPKRPHIVGVVNDGPGRVP